MSLPAINPFPETPLEACPFSSNPLLHRLKKIFHCNAIPGTDRVPQLWLSNPEKEGGHVLGIDGSYIKQTPVPRKAEPDPD